MADFAQWMVAAEPALRWPEGTFMHAYDSNRMSANTMDLEASPIVPALHRVCARGHWTGTATQLWQELSKFADGQDKQDYWPKNGWALSVQLRRIAANLRAAGLDINLGKKTPGKGSKRIIAIKKLMPKDQIRRFPRLQ
jgi:putative DNA primase/helicase